MVVGIDEVGRGSWAGPLVFAGVILPTTTEYMDLLGDSKKLTPTLREVLSDSIIKTTNHCIVEISNDCIDEYGLTECSRSACLKIANDLNLNEVSTIIIDGNVNYLNNTKYESIAECIIKADNSEPSVMAASIIAKVYRDNKMIEISKIYPGYDFHSNFGYGTNKHILSLKTIGITPLHRKSYKPIQNFL